MGDAEGKINELARNEAKKQTLFRRMTSGPETPTASHQTGGQRDRQS